MAGKVLCVRTKEEKKRLLAEMTAAGYWLASTKGRTENGVNLLMLTFYENGLRTSSRGSDQP